MKKLMKSKKGAFPLVAFLAAAPWILGLTLFGIPVFATWLKVVTTPAKPMSPIWIIICAFIVLILLKKRRE